MAKNNKFSKLMLDIEKMPNLIRIWCESNLEGDFKIESKEITQRHQFFVINNGKKIQLDFIKCSESLFTIMYKVGADQSQSLSIAEFIYSNVSDSLKNSPYANGFSIVLPKDEVLTVIELLKDDGNTLMNYSTCDETGKAAYSLYNFKGIRGDSVTLKYYNRTRRLQVQGKPLYLFHDILSLISETGASTDIVVDTHLEMCNVSVKKDDIYDEMKLALSEDVFKYFPQTHKAILASTFIQFKINVTLLDYSCIIYPAYRAYEGFIRKVFTQNGLDCIGQKNIGKYFYTDNDTFVMRSEFSNDLEDEKVKIMTQLYAFYNKNRHPYGHASGDDFQTRIISNRDVAYNKFLEVINNIKKAYTIIV